MVERIIWRIWSTILSSFALIVTNIDTYGETVRPKPPKVVQEITIRKSTKPIFFLQQALAGDFDDLMVAGHRSHASHRSHGSHASHYSGSVGTPSSPPVRPSPPPAIQQTPQAPSAPHVKPSRPSVVSPAPETQKEPAEQSTISSETALGLSNLEIKKIHLIYEGVSIDCDMAWQASNVEIYYTQNGKIFTVPLRYIDINKTLSGASRRPATSSDPAEQSTIPAGTNFSLSNRNLKTVYFKNGSHVYCDAVWQSENKVNCIQNSKTFELPLEIIDTEKTLAEVK